jgi:glycosyltransferase involved in cell wall biosynthesis
MKDILIISNYWHFEPEKTSSRYLSIANMMLGYGMTVEVITSTFYHATKSQRMYDKAYFDNFKYKTTLIFEHGYKNNVSLERLKSHKEFSNNVLKYLVKRKTPDVIYCFVPSLTLGEVVTKFANDNGIKVVIDILDLWPEAYKMVFSVPIISDLLFKPIIYKANKVYISADEIVAVSDTYVSRALEVNKKCKVGHSIYIGIDLKYFDQCARKENTVSKHKNEIWIGYIGSLGYSYDITVVIDALKILANKKIKNIKFIVMGDGPFKSKFESYSIENGINVEFTGRLNYVKMIQLLTSCDIAVNPIIHGASQSIINKHADYLAAGLPILNTQECQEFRNLITEYNVGLNCENNDSKDLANKILKLYKDEKLRKTMGQNSRTLAEEKFNRSRTYKRIMELLDND